MQKTCPSCGKPESASLPFVKAFCINCFSEREKLFEAPAKAEIKRCNTCEKYFVSGKWQEQTREQIGEFIAGKVKSPIDVSASFVSMRPLKKGFLVDLDVEIDVDGVIVKKRAAVQLAILRGLCDNCHKKSGGYSEAIIQLRGATREKLRKIARDIIAQLEAESYISDFEDTRNGIDFSVGSRSLAIRVIGRMGRHYTQSNTLIGMREGKRMYRATICVRFD